QNDEKTKADMALIKETVERLESLHADQIEAILGPRQEIPENYLLPASYWSRGVTLSAHQDAGESSTAFFPIAELGGIYVIQFENRSTISAAVIYLKRDHSYKADDRAETLKSKEAAREAE
ncbi:MAG TPA: hypothetical protein PLA50_12995, partial [Bacteroidia bacterium]|nr:hypothetical protein [Bacteroidia bacterium]